MTVPVVYKIRDWTKHFETSESTKRKGPLAWVAITTKHDGKSYRRLSRQPNCDAIYGAWILIVAVAGKCPVRGTLADADGPLTPDDMEDKTGFPAATFTRAFELLSSERFPWMEVVNLPEPAENSADVLKTQPTEQNRTEQNQTIHNRTEQETGSVLKKRFCLWRNATWKQVFTPSGAQEVFELATKCGACTPDERILIFRLILSLEGDANKLPGLLTKLLRGEGDGPWQSRGSTDDEQKAREWMRDLDVPPETQQRTSDLATGPPGQTAKQQAEALLKKRPTS